MPTNALKDSIYAQATMDDWAAAMQSRDEVEYDTSRGGLCVSTDDSDPSMDELVEAMEEQSNRDRHLSPSDSLQSLLWKLGYTVPPPQHKEENNKILTLEQIQECILPSDPVKRYVKAIEAAEQIIESSTQQLKRDKEFLEGLKVGLEFIKGMSNANQ